MKTSLTHLPGYKQEEILKITDIIREVVAPEKIILFGSYAKGTWVEDEYIEHGTRFQYISDYDFLIVTKNNEEKEYLLNDKIMNRSRHITKVSVNCLIHDIDYINEGLSIGQYFFTDIVKEGVLLYNSSNVQFAEAKKLTLKEQKEIAENYFEIWFKRGSDFLQIAIDCVARNNLNLGAFQLHQATENFYNTVLLVFSGYKPKTHSLEKLRQYAKLYSKKILQIFPEMKESQSNSSLGDGGNEFHLFDLLKRGYIDARYKHDYIITQEELTALIEKVKAMQQVVENICRERMNSLITHLKNF